MNVEMKIVLDVGKQDSTNDAIEAAKNAVKEIDSRDLVNMMLYEVVD